MQTVNPKIAFDSINLRDIQDPQTRNALTVLADLLRIQFDIVTRVINSNAILYKSQNAQPDPAEGEFIIWRDADAGAGTPKAYIVTKQGGAVYTFASRELV